VTAARGIVPLPLQPATDALCVAVGAGAPFSDVERRWILELHDGVHIHHATPGCGDWTWLGVHGTVHGLRAFGRAVAVELTVEPWSRDAVELGLRPRRGRLDDAFHEAAAALLRSVGGVLLVTAEAATAIARPQVARTARRAGTARPSHPVVVPAGG
jgi:hypothetical protein